MLAMRNLLKFSSLSLFLIINSGCAEKIKEVYIPIKCDVPKRERPALEIGDKIVVSVKLLLVYTEQLEQDLNFCRGE